jgi:hypothetical protein
MNVRNSLLVALVACTAPGCELMHAATFDGFDQGMLNATWYGAYTRPVERLSDAEIAAQRQRADERAAAADARRDERIAERQERRQTTQQQTAVADPTPAPEPPPEQPERPDEDVIAAVAVLDMGDGYWSPDLAAAYIRDTYDANRASLPTEANGLTDIYRLAVRNGAVYYNEYPAAGDVVFFNHTWDRNADNRDNDYYTHAGIVEGVDEDGTISILSFCGDEVTRTYMNLLHAQTSELNGRVVNTPLRERHGEEGSNAWLSSHLFAGFAAFLGADVQEVHLLDEWDPRSHLATATR